ncbi:MAG: hypothetical protein CFH43_00002 [Proteobacteria bacterium]|nr:MAG: hypothetical protein CFH43_00002 [Pseudomonadota bacterium]
MQKFSIFILGLGLFTLYASYSMATGIGPTTAPSMDATLHSTSESVDYMVASFYCDVRDLISGTFGTVIGLLVSMAGLYSYLMSRSKYGFFFFIAGVALTGLPGLFDWYFKGVVKAFGDSEIASRKGYSAADYEDVETLDSWCAGTAIAADTNEASPLSSEKDQDANAAKGIGLHSLSSGDTNGDAYQYYMINEDGSPLTVSPNPMYYK